MITKIQKYENDKCNIKLNYQKYMQNNKLKISNISVRECELIKESFMRSFGRILREIARWQKIGDLSSIGWISLMFIRDSIKNKEYEFRWDLYDEERNLFINAPIFYWRPEELFEQLEEECKKFIKFSGSEIEEVGEERLYLIKEVIIADYFDFLERVCKEGMDEILKYDVWQNIEKSDNIKVSFEHFISSGCMLYQQKSNNKYDI